MLKKTNEQDSLTNGDKMMNKKRLEEIVKQEKSKVLSEAKIGPNDKFYIATKTFTADTGRITKGELYISTGKPTKVKVQGDDGPFWSTEINVEMANPNYEAFEGIDPNGFNKLFKEVDPNKDLKAMKYLSKWGLVEHGDTYYVGSWSPGRETSLEHAKTMLSKLKKVSSESPNQAVLKIAGYKGSMIDIARGITVVRKWADMYEIVFDDKTKSISPQKLVNLLKKGGSTRQGKQVQLLKAGMNEGFTKKDWDVKWKLPKDNLFNATKTIDAINNRYKALQNLLKDKPKELKAFDSVDDHLAYDMSYDELMKWYNKLNESVNEAKSKIEKELGQYASFELGGKSYHITKIEDYGNWAMITTQGGKEWKSDTLKKKGAKFIEKAKSKKTAWNKGQKTTSQKDYLKILKGAMKDARGMAAGEFTHDMASSMIYDTEIQSYLNKAYPGFAGNKRKMLQRLQWDLEMFAEGIVNEINPWPFNNKNWEKLYDDSENAPNLNTDRKHMKWIVANAKKYGLDPDRVQKLIDDWNAWAWKRAGSPFRYWVDDKLSESINEGKYNVGDKFTTTQYGKTTNWWIDKIKGTSIQLDNDHPTFSKFGLHIQDFDTQVKKKKFIPVNESIKIVESINEDLPTKEIDPKEFPNPLPSSKKGFLKKGDPKNDGGKADDDVVPTKDVQIAVSKLKPSQDAIYLGKSLAMAINGVEGGDLGAVISKDNYILDGHHRYAATSFNNPNASVGGVRANLNIGDLIPVLRAVGDAMKNKRGVEPKGGDVNIFKATMDDIKNVIYKGKNVPAQYYDKEKSIAWFEAIGEDVLSKRLKQLQSKRPPAGAPMRKDMPKIRPGQINLLKALLNKGKIDVREPYAENVNEVNWSSLHNDNKKQSLLDAIKIVKNNKVGSERKKAMNYILARAKEASNGTSPRTYKQALQMLDMSESVNNETINRIINEEVDKFVSGLTEGKWTKIMKNARELNVGGTWTVIANDVNKRKVVGQYPTKIMAMIPALYEKAKKEHPDAKITVENGEGKSFVAESVNENGIMYKAGVKKYGKEGMTKIQSAAGKDLGHEEIGKIKDKYEKGKKGKNEAIEEDLGSVGGMSIPTIVSSLFALYVMFKIAYTTNADVQELKKLGKAILMRVPILGPKLAKKDFVKGLDTIFKTADMSKIESYLTKNPKLSKIIGQIKGGDTYAWKKLYGELKDMDYKAYGQSQKIISKFYQSLKPSKKK
jgi:hypothetical protein